MWSSNLQISFLSTAILALGKARNRREPNLCCRGLTVLGDVILCKNKKKNSLHDSCRMGRRIVVMKLICSLGHCECDGHTVHKLSQRRLTADWLAPRESDDCSRMHSKISSDRLPSYIKATRPVLEIFKIAGYFPDRPRMSHLWHNIRYNHPDNIRRRIHIIKSACRPKRRDDFNQQFRWPPGPVY